jgi:hypothetical protein
MVVCLESNDCIPNTAKFWFAGLVHSAGSTIEIKTSFRLATVQPKAVTIDKKQESMFENGFEKQFFDLNV